MSSNGPETGGLSIAALTGPRTSTTPRIVVGIGARRGVDIRDVRMALGEGLVAAGARARDLVAIVTVEAKQSEPALLDLAEMLGVPLRAIPAEVLAAQPVPNPSPVAEHAVGTPSVAEAAVLAVGAELIHPKLVAHGVTVAVGRLSETDADLETAGPGGTVGPTTAVGPQPQDEDSHEDLTYHGDVEVAPGLVDLAVNVRPTPAWLQDRLRAAVDQLAGYPNPAEATAAVAARHARPPEQVLLTAGAAEAFVLLARALAPHRAVVVHPQFTEPEAALQAAGHAVSRVILEPPFDLDPSLVPDDADLVFLGNPTNPTSVLHPIDAVLALTRPGRVLVVDEAFMDAVPGEPAGLAGSRARSARDVPGLVVVRSLTKTWGLAGLRIGYLLGDPQLLQACRAVQPLWSVGSLALAAAIACSTPEATAEAEAIARDAVGEREFLLGLLAGLDDVEVVAAPQAPFVLLRLLGPDPAGVHQRLRADGWAVRRADTFPGLAPGRVRIAIRDRATSAAFVTALERAVHPAPAEIDLRGTEFSVTELSDHRQEPS